MEWNDFKKKLQKAGLSVDIFATMMNKSKSSIYSWSSRGIPDWVESWLDNYIKARKCEYELKELSDEYDLLHKVATRVFWELDKKNLINEIVKNPQDVHYIMGHLEFYKDIIKDLPYEAVDKNHVPLETEAETKANEVVAKAPKLDEDVKQEIIAAFKEEILKELRKAKEEERIAKKLQEIEQKMQEIQKKLDEQEKKEG